MLQTITPQTITLFIFVVLLVWAAICDLTSLRVPNLACAGIGAVFFIHTILRADITWALHGALIGAAIFAFGAVLFARGYLGGGDVKMLAAVAMWAGSDKFLDFILVTAVAGASFALVMMSPIGFYIQGINGGLARRRMVMPYGVAIAIGGLFIAFKLFAA